MMRFASMGSGSAGNCMVVQNASTHVLLDCGFGAKETLSRLQKLDIAPEQISAILVTHEHDDHAKGAFKLAAKFAIPVWLTHGTLKMCQRYIPENTDLTLQMIDTQTPFMIDALEITPYTVPHDAREPTQFTFSDGQYKLGVLTDAGSSTQHIENVLSGCDALVLECNHDLNMLENGPYAWALKQRVSSRLGHLDNDAAATLLSKLDNSKLKHIIAAHLSAKNNSPEFAKKALSLALNCDPEWVGIADQTSGFSWRSF